MVRRTLENLRARPHEERTAIAASIAVGVVAILLIGWLIYFFHEVDTAPPATAQNTLNATDENGLENAQQQFQQAYGSTTQFLDVDGNTELQPVSTTSDSSE